MLPHEPLIRVEAPLIQAQLVETASLNLVNFSTLIATKAARVRQSCGTDQVLEFGLRRAQGPDGGLMASRAAYLGGADATSNVWAGQHLGVPVRGTHAHSWVMVFKEELDAFERYADALPNNCVFLVDTYDTIEGVRHAISVGIALREKGHRLQGVRLDSGDLAALSKKARQLLDEAGFEDAVVIASNDLDEHIIHDLKDSGGKIDVWGVGTRLVTAFEQPALGGVYKLAAIEDENGQWQPRIKRSEQEIKTSNPGRQQVRRFFSPEGQPMADVIYDIDLPPSGTGIVFTPFHRTGQETITEATFTDLLQPIFLAGRCVYTFPDWEALRQLCRQQVESFVSRSEKPYIYGLEDNLLAQKKELLATH
ncbi:MAG: nicotinate phosphoribosyltransferase [Saprospiraceae bacterium]